MNKQIIILIISILNIFAAKAQIQKQIQNSYKSQEIQGFQFDKNQIQNKSIVLNNLLIQTHILQYESISESLNLRISNLDGELLISDENYEIINNQDNKLIIKDYSICEINNNSLFLIITGQINETQEIFYQTIVLSNLGQSKKPYFETKKSEFKLFKAINNTHFLISLECQNFNNNIYFGYEYNEEYQILKFDQQNQQSQLISSLKLNNDMVVKTKWEINNNNTVNYYIVEQSKTSSSNSLKLVQQQLNSQEIIKEEILLENNQEFSINFQIFNNNNGIQAIMEGTQHSYFYNFEQNCQLKLNSPQNPHFSWSQGSQIYQITFQNSITILSKIDTNKCESHVQTTQIPQLNSFKTKNQDFTVFVQQKEGFDTIYINYVSVQKKQQQPLNMNLVTFNLNHEIQQQEEKQQQEFQEFKDQVIIQGFTVVPVLFFAFIVIAIQKNNQSIKKLWNQIIMKNSNSKQQQIQQEKSDASIQIQGEVSEIIIDNLMKINDNKKSNKIQNNNEYGEILFTNLNNA